MMLQDDPDGKKAEGKQAGNGHLASVTTLLVDISQ